MDYDELYDESPYVSKEVLRRGGVMPIMRATFLICATILASVFAVMFYGYQQDQFIVTSNGNFISIFDRKSKTISMCDKGNCTLVTPMFETHQSTIHQGSPASQTVNPQQGAQPGQRLIGSFPQPQGATSPQMQGQPQPAQPQPGQVQMTGGNPQAQQMLQQLEQMEIMAQRTANQPMNPQRIQFIRQRIAMEDQALAARLLNPQMIQQVRQLRAIEDQQMAQAQQQAAAGTAAGNPAGNAAGNTTGNAAPASGTAAEETTSEETAADETAKTEGAAEEPAAAEESEEAAPV